VRKKRRLDTAVGFAERPALCYRSDCRTPEHRACKPHSGLLVSDTTGGIP
jgi:hypothetical protein